MAEHYFRRTYHNGIWPVAECSGCDWTSDSSGSHEAFRQHLEEVAERDALTNLVDDIIAAADPESQHAREDDLHINLIHKYAPQWVRDEITRLSAADFPRWCA